MQEEQGSAPRVIQRADRSVQPVVFMFQPTRFEVVRGEKLKEWETLLRERVGLTTAMVPIDGGGGSCCVSYCPDADDCDGD